MNLVERVLAITDALSRHRIPYAVGGALALAYATEEPRGTRDIDVNVFVPSEDVDKVFSALPTGVRATASDRKRVLQDDQVRLWWDDTPIDVFFAAEDFHLQVAKRCIKVPFANQTIKILCADDLAVFKAMFNRPKDWVDIDEMAISGSLNRAKVARRLAEILGHDDPRISRVAARED